MLSLGSLAFTMTIIICMASYLSSFSFYGRNPHVMSTDAMKGNLKVNIKDLQMGRECREDCLHSDKVIGTIDFEFDFGQAFNWNTRQIFAYIVAEYQTDNLAVNQVTLWDSIVQRSSNWNYKLKKAKFLYPFFHHGLELDSNTNVTFALHWEYEPFMGPVTRMPGILRHTMDFSSF